MSDLTDLTDMASVVNGEEPFAGYSGPPHDHEYHEHQSLSLTALSTALSSQAPHSHAANHTRCPLTLDSIKEPVLCTVDGKVAVWVWVDGCGCVCVWVGVCGWLGGCGWICRLGECGCGCV